MLLFSTVIFIHVVSNKYGMSKCTANINVLDEFYFYPIRMCDVESGSQLLSVDQQETINIIR